MHSVYQALFSLPPQEPGKEAKVQLDCATFLTGILILWWKLLF